MIGLVHRARRPTTAVESAGLVEDLGVAVRRRHRNFPELSRAQDHDFHPSASVDAERVGFQVHPLFRETPLRVASAGQEQAGPVVAVERVEVRPDLVRQVAALRQAERIADATERPAVAMAVEPQAQRQKAPLVQQASR
jgi:hypothetical protein